VLPALLAFGGKLEIGVLEGLADVAAGEGGDLFDGFAMFQPAPEQVFDFFLGRRLEFEDGEAAGKAGFKFLELAVAGAENHCAGRFV